jgi:hypothetical protein
MSIASPLLLRLLVSISATPTHGIIAIGAAGVHAGTICVILSFEIVDADAGVIGVAWIVRTEVLA